MRRTCASGRSGTAPAGADATGVRLLRQEWNDEDGNTDEVGRTMPDQQIKRLPDVNRDKRFVGILPLGDLGVSQGAGFTPTELATEAAITLEKEGQGFRISKSALTLRAQVPGIERDKFEELARTAEKNCPAPKVLNAEITMDFTLG